MKHGYGVNTGKNPTYRSWEAMKYRCDNPTCTQWEDYGGRGIRYCERWSDFANFLADMGPRPLGMTLDRIEVNGNYGPENCRWATRETQRQNRRDVRLYEHQGGLYTLGRLAKDHGLSIHFLFQRINRDGMSVQEAIDRPTRRTRSANNRGQDKVLR